MAKLKRGITSRVVSAKDDLGPYLASGWLYSWGLIALVTVYIWQMIVRYSSKMDSRKRRWKAHERMNSIWHQVMGSYTVDFNPFWKRVVEYETPVNELPKQALYMANHTSFADTLFLSGAFKHTITAVGKKDLYDTPLLGPITKNNGMLPVAFVRDENGKWTTDKSSVKRMMEKAEEKLNYGSSICVFPEGKISIDGTLGKFKPGFFRLALKTNTPIIPTGCWGNQQAWPMKEDKRGFSVPQFYAFPGTSYIHCGEPVWTYDAIDFESDSTLQELIERCTREESSPLEESDFTKENWEALCQKLFESEKEIQPCEELLSAFVDKLMQVVRNEMAVIVADAKEQWEKDVDTRSAEREDYYNYIDETLFSFLN